MMQGLRCLLIALLLGCSSSSLRLPVDARPADAANPAIPPDAADGQPSRLVDSAVDRQPTIIIDSAIEEADAGALDTPSLDTADLMVPAPADATPAETLDATETGRPVEAGPVETRDALMDATKDAAISGGEAGVDGDPGLPFCAQPTTSASVVLEIPADTITVDAAYGSSPSDVWVTTLPDHRVARWNGSVWTWVGELAAVPILAIAGSGAADVWLGGIGGVLWHWNGTALSAVSSKTGLDIRQIAVLGSGQAFALAFVPLSNSTFDLIRLTGSEWSVVGPSIAMDPYTEPHGLYAPTPNEAWVAAYDHVFHYQNDTLTTVAVASALNVWGTAPDNVWFGKCKWDGEKIVELLSLGSGPIWGTGPSDMWIDSTHWDGQTATDYSSSLLWPPVAIRGVSATDVWATTTSGRIVHFDGSQTWTEVIADPGTSIGAAGLATGIWPIGADALWIAGPYNQIYLYQTGALTPIPDTGAPPSDDLLGVWGSSANDLWAVGKNGAILHGNGVTWTRVPSQTTSNLQAVSGSAAGDVWAVGDAGTVLHWDGTAWSAVSATTDAALYGVWATEGFVVAVGANGTIIANDGNGFALQPSGTVSTLHGVWGRTPIDVYAVDGQNLFTYDGKEWASKAIANDTCVSGVWGTSDGVFADGYYYDGSPAVRLVPAYVRGGGSSPLCLDLDGVWAGSADDFWSVGGIVSLLAMYGGRGIYRFHGACIDVVASNLFSSTYEDTVSPYPSMRAIFGIGEHDLWAAGDLGMIAHIRR